MNWKYVRHFIRGLIYIPISLVIIIALLVGTPLGSQVSVSALNYFIPYLKVSYQSGTLNKTIHIKNFEWIDKSVSITADDILFTWRPHCFLQMQLCINDIKATKTKVTVHSDTTINDQVKVNDSSESTDSNAFLLPFGIIAKQAYFSDLAVYVDKQKYATKQLAFTAQWLESGMIITKLDADRFSMTGIWPNSDKFDENNNSENQKAPTGSLKLPSVELPFQLTVHHSNFQDSQLELDGKLVEFKHISIDGYWRGSHLTLKEFQLKHSTIDVGLTGNINFVSNYPLNLKIHAKLDNRSKSLSTSLPWLRYLKEMKLQSLKTQLSKNLSDIKYSLQLNGDINSNADGNINTLNTKLPFKINIKNLDGLWKIPQGRIISDQTRLTARGDIHSVNLDVKGNFKTPFIPQVYLNANGQVSHKNIKLNQLIIESSSGSIDAKGSIAWEKYFLWDLDAQFDHFKLQKYSQHFTDKIPEVLLNGKLKTNGQIKSDSWRVHIDDSNLTGLYNSSPIIVKGGVDFNSSYQLRSEGLNAQFMGDELQLIQKNDKKLHGKLVINNLSTLLPDLKGSLHSTFITKPEQHPKFDFHVRGKNLEYQNYQVESLISSGSYLPLKNHYVNSLTQLTNLTIFKHRLRIIQIKAQTDLTTQSADITIRSNLNARLQINSLTTNNGWKFKLPTLDVFTQRTSWHLNTPITASWDKNQKQAFISRFCLLKNGEGLCLKDQAKLGSTGHVKVSYNGGITDVTKPYLPEHIEFEGNAYLNSNIEWQQGKKPTGNLELRLPNGKIRLFPQKGIPRVFDYQSLSITGNLSSQLFKLKTKLRSKNLAHLDTQLDIGTEPEHPLDGLVDIHNFELAPIAEFIPLFQKLNGKLTSKVKISGSLKKPIFDGNAAIKNTDIVLVENPTKVHNLNANLKIQNRKLLIASQWNMDEGRARLNGDLNWQNKKLAGKLVLKGKDLSVIKPPFAILTVNPDINIAIEGRRIDFSGKVDVPSGTITITPLPKEGTPLSSDVIYVNQKKKSLSTDFLQLVTNIDVNVSDKVKIKGMGLFANLGGKISLRQKQQETPLLFGSIKVINGSYRFFGQTLNISEGSLEFVGPADNPNVNIVAIKNIADEDLTVGVKMTGPARKPTVTLFSNPVKEQAEIVSYLFQGHSFFNDTTDNSNDAMLLSAALTIGSQAGNNPISSIGNSAESVLNKLGVKNVQLNANDEGKVAVSGYIGDRLLVKYGYGVFNPGYELSLRFYLLSQLYLETVSSAVGQSFDIYYRFSFN